MLATFILVIIYPTITKYLVAFSGVILTQDLAGEWTHRMYYVVSVRGFFYVQKGKKVSLLKIHPDRLLGCIHCPVQWVLCSSPGSKAVGAWC